MRKLLVCFTTITLVLAACVKEDDSPSYYSINLRVQGSPLSSIYYRSSKWNFDVNNMPNVSWSVDNNIYGDDTIALYGNLAVPDSVNKIKVTITLQKDNDPPIVFADSGSVSAVARGYVPK